MNRRVSWVYFCLGAVIYSLVAVFQSSPGYMDAEYYTATALQLADGKGFQEPFIWNYLNQPAGIPAPSHLYWMPLASLLAALGKIAGWGEDFLRMRLPFVLVAALLAPAAVNIAQGFVREKRNAWLSGILAAFAGLYWIYLTLPETFGCYMLLGAGLIGLVGGTSWLRIGKNQAIILGLLVGVLSGLMHLTRADGILWLAGCLAWMGFKLCSARKNGVKNHILRIVIIIAPLLLGYSLVIGGWYLRNLDLFGSLMPPGNSRTLWLTDYNQTYNYDVSSLTIANWMNSGIGSILLSRWQALKLNLANLLVVQGGIVVLPLTVLGAWHRRNDDRIRFLVFMWLLTLLIMTVVFPFAGARGGYLHSGAAFQLYFWALAPVGLERLVERGMRKRGWNPRGAFKFFTVGLAAIAIVLSGFFYFTRVLGPNPTQPIWGRTEGKYRKVAESLNDVGISAERIAAVNNPPDWYLATGRSSIVIPNGGVEELLAAADRYLAEYLLLEPAQENLSELYANPGDREGLDYLTTIEDVQIYRILIDD
jgi:hypothetical protein